MMKKNKMKSTMSINKSINNIINKEKEVIKKDKKFKSHLKRDRN
jgi:hypothetical protein